jgi:hypothetical protein
MTKAKFDGLIEAVRYTAAGQIELVRFYERRGAAFSDHRLLTRAGLVERLQNGQKFVTGQRQAFLGNLFEVGQPVYQAGDFIATQPTASRDLLEAVPLF